jgi:hypothetical protein
MNRVALRRGLLMTLVFCAGAAAPTLVEQIAFAQVKPPEFVKPGPNAPATVGKFLSGEDVGFRFSNLDRDGAAVGTLMVKINGNWVEARFGSKPHSAAASR